ncbi:MAG: anti-sigma factor family protein [Bryobacteraceae bacterium]
MPCPAFEDLILEYCEGGLPAEERGRVEAHVAECPACRAFLEVQRDLDSALREAIGKPQPSAAFGERILRRVSSEAEEPRSWVPLILDAVGYSAMAALGSVVIQVSFTPAQFAWLMMGASATFLWWMSWQSLRQGL